MFLSDDLQPFAGVDAQGLASFSSLFFVVCVASMIRVLFFVAGFDATFFNLFNYNHGSLNAHVDRGLLTIVYGFCPDVVDPDPALSSSSSSSPVQTSRLWVRSNASTSTADDDDTDGWVDVQRVCDENHVLLFAGEQLVACTTSASPSAKLNLRAIDHCVRVDPRGEYLSHSHHNRDPAAAPTGNRLSAAMIFAQHEI